MVRNFFKCTFLSDIVLNASTATEGRMPSLDYVPGSNFLGIVARNYNSFGKRAFDIFHSGKVRFGDAHPALGNRRSWKAPLSWFHKKTEEFCSQNGYLLPHRIYLHHELGELKEQFRREGTQLKQIRSGFVIEDGRILDSDHFFTIKSAYNSQKRRSQDSQMYGYHALPRGSEWIFYIDADEDELLKEIGKKIEGKHNIGRSRSAQYGKVVIEKSDSSEKAFSPGPLTNGKLLLYAESSLAFLDRFGEATFVPSLEDLDLSPEKSGLSSKPEILWEESQIRTRVFAPWNQARKARDRDRVCLDKGSVIVVKISDTNFDVEKFATSMCQGIGLYRQEGMGQVLVNPSFLQGKITPDGESREVHPKFVDKKAEKENLQASHFSIVEADDSDAKIIKWLENKEQEEKENVFILQKVNEFVKQNSAKFPNTDISSSQWGMVRAQAQVATNCEEMCDILFREEERNGKKGFLMHGQSATQWNKYGRSKLLKTVIAEVNQKYGERCARVFTMKLCAEMARKVRGQ